MPPFSSPWLGGEGGAWAGVAVVGDGCGEGDGHFGSAAGAAGDVKERAATVEDFEAFADIFHADA